MSITLTIWRAHLKSLRNASRHDTQMRLALGVVFVFNIIAGLWSAEQLSARLHQWQTMGAPALDAGLWWLCWLTWSGMSFFAVLGSIRLAFSSDEAQLLVVLPIAPASRFRTLYGLFFGQLPHPLTGGACIRTPPQFGIPVEACRFGLTVRHIGGN